MYLNGKVTTQCIESIKETLPYYVQEQGQSNGDPEESMERKQKWLPKFNKITRELSAMMLQYRELTFIEMTEDEVLNGFSLSDII